MKGTDIFPSKWLKADDLGENEPTVVISHVLLEDVSDKDRKPVIYFQGKKKGMVCNKTNWNRISYIHKSDDSDDWTGKPITLYVELVDMQGSMKPAIRVKAAAKREMAAPDRQMVKNDNGSYQSSTMTRKTEPVVIPNELPNDEVPF